MERNKEFIDALIGVQAECAAQAHMLMALISSHPDPSALRLAWNAQIAAPMATAALAAAGSPQDGPVYQRVIAGMQAWTDRLESHLSGP